MSYQVKRKGRTICKIKPNSMNVRLLIYLIDVLVYSIHGTYAGCKEQLRDNRKELKQ